MNRQSPLPLIVAILCLVGAACLYVASFSGHSLPSSGTQTAQVTGSLSQGLAGYWTLNGGSSSTAADSSGNGHTATLTNVPTALAVNGVTGLSFNGSNQAFASPAIDLSGTPSASVTFWLSSTLASPAGSVIFESSPNFNQSTTGFGMFYSDTANGTCPIGDFSIDAKGNAGYNAKCYAASSATGLHQYTVVFDNTQSAANQISFYIDGALQAPVSQPYASKNTNNFGSNSLYFMARDASSGYFVGTLADIGLYSRALSSSDVQGIVSAGLTPGTIAAPVISNVSNSPVTTSSATTAGISWTTNVPATSQVQYGLTSAYGSNSALASSLVTAHSVVLSNLQPNTVYHYQVDSNSVSTNPSGSLAASADYTFTTAANPTPAPTAALSVSPSSITSGSYSTINWSSTNAASCTGTNFIARGTGGQGPVYPTVTTTYTMTCTGPGGTSNAASATVTVTQPVSGKFSIGQKVITNGVDNVRSTPAGTLLGTQASSTVGTITAGPQTGVLNGTTFTWWDVSFSSGSSGWVGEGNLNPYVTTVVPTASLTASPATITAGQSSTLTWSSTNAASCTGTGFTASGTTGSVTVTPSQTTTYSVTCSGSAAANATVTVNPVINPVPPSTPAALTATAVSSSQVNLSWTASVGSVAGYNIYRNGTKLTTTTSTSYSDTGLAAATAYSYGVSAYDSAGDTSQQASVSATTLAAASGKFTIGQQVITIAIDNVRSTPAGTLLGTQASSTVGTVTAGPQAAVLNGTSFNWWDTSFSSGVSGWIGEDNLIAYVAPSSYSFASSVTGSGSLTCNGTTCPSTATLNANSVSNLVATPASGWTLTTFTVTGPSNTCSTTNASCSFTATANTTVSAVFTNTSAPSATLGASPSAITAGQSSTLTWSSKNATSCTGTGFTASGTTGSVTVTPSVTTTYSVTCSGSSAASATVTVNPVITSTGNWYVRPGGAGSQSGADWNNATDMSNIPWSSVKPGNVIWVAGGTYSTVLSGQNAPLTPLASGTAGNLIYIKHILSTDAGLADASAAGWSSLPSSAFGQTIIKSPSDFAVTWNDSSGLGSHLYFDGRTANGISFQMNNLGGVSYPAPIYFNTGANGQTDITFNDIDAAGPIPPGSITSANPTYSGNAYESAVTFRGGPYSGSGIYVTNITFSNCNIHGGFNLVTLIGVQGITFDHCNFYDSPFDSGPQANHPNLMEWGFSGDVTVRYSTFTNWYSEGIKMGDTEGDQAFGPLYLYGNVFYNPNNPTPSGGATQGSRIVDDRIGTKTLYAFNNTLVNFSGAAFVYDSTEGPFSSNSIVANNLYWNSQLGYPLSNTDYEYTNTSAPGSNTKTFSANPFVDLTSGNGGNYHLTANTPAGENLTSIGTSLGLTGLNVDPDGTPRTTWTRGAYEYTAAHAQ